jgi:hypothetical protein
MRENFLIGCVFLLIVVGCAERPAAIPATATPAPTGVPRRIPTPTVEINQSPPPCWEADLIYHTRFKKMMLVNCIADPGKPSLHTLWIWDGTRWQKIIQDGPPGRILGGAVYDDLRDTLVLYGGRPVELGRCSQETWEWDGEFWEQINASPPTACDHVRMVYDASRKKSILFSGLDPSENRVNETWSWNGQMWELLTEEGPQSRGHFGFVYDPGQKQALLYGGYASQVSDEFWMWKDNTWEQIDSPGPGALSHFGMTLDIDSNALYIFGGATSDSTFSSLTNKTWVLKDGRWAELRIADSPSARGGPALGYDPVRKRVVMYGGFDSDRNNLNDTWEWDGESWTCMVNCD